MRAHVFSILVASGLVACGTSNAKQPSAHAGESVLSATSAPPRTDSAPTSWVQVHAEDGLFDAEFPSLPTLASDQVEAKWGPHDEQKYLAVVPGDVEFEVGWSDFPSGKYVVHGLVRPAEAGGQQTVCQGAAANVSRASLFMDIGMVHAGFPARDCGIDNVASNGIPIRTRMRVVLVDRRLYMVTVVGRPERINERDVERFFSAFRVTRMAARSP